MEEEQEAPLENLLYLFMLAHPVTNADKIYRYWHKDVTLREYTRPQKEELWEMVESITVEIRTLLISC